jgi:hypothetical protein
VCETIAYWKKKEEKRALPHTSQKSKPRQQIGGERERKRVTRDQP